VTKYLHLVWAGLWRSRTRAVFTLLSIAVAFALFGLLQGISAWFTGALPGARADRLIVVSRVSELEPLPSAYLEKIKQVSGVRRATVVGALPAIYQDRGNDVLVLATDPAAVFDIYPDWHTSPNAVQALSMQRTGLIVGAALMKKYGWKVGDRVPLRTSVLKQDGSTDWTFEIVGTFSVPDGPMQENRLIGNYAYFDEARMFDKGRAFAFIVAIDDARHSTQICATIDSLFANSSDETSTQNEAEYAQSQLRQLGDVGMMVNAIVGAVLFTLLFLTGNTMRQAVRERIPELAVLKAIGYSDGMVTALVLAESMLMCLVAALAGLAVAALIFPITAALGIRGGALPVSVVVSGVLIALALALASGLPPAWQARRLPIVDALAGR
jgi:putative ABC transport system permease protein